MAGLPGAVVCTLGCCGTVAAHCASIVMAVHAVSQPRTVQGTLAGLRPAVVALIASAGLSLLVLTVFRSPLSEIVVSDFRVVEAVIFVVCLVLLRKYKLNPVVVIFGSGIVGTIVYLII